MTAGIAVPVTLHLDHCPDRERDHRVPRGGLELGAVRRLASSPVAENQRQTIEVVAEARRYGAHVEGEIEGVTGVEDGIGSDAESAPADPRRVGRLHRGDRRRLLRAGHRQRARRVHGRRRRSTPSGSPTSSSATRSRWRCTAAAGLTDEQFRDLIARGCAKVNISTALKIAVHATSNLRVPADAEAADKWDPPSLFAARAGRRRWRWPQRHMRIFGSAGQGREPDRR